MWTGSAADTLLYHVSQFVRQQPSPPGCSRGVLPGTEDDMIAHVIDKSIHRAGRLCRLRAGMHSHTAKIVSEARLHNPARCRVERLARQAQYLVDDVGYGVDDRSMAGSALQHRRFAFLAAGPTLAAGAGRAATGAFALQDAGRHRRDIRTD